MTPKAAATRYARALFDVARKEADVTRVDAELSEFASLITGHELLYRVLSNPAVPVPRKRAVIEDVLQRVGAVSPPLAKLLLMMADRDRLVLLPQLATAYHARLLEHAGVVRAEVTTAAPLPGDRIAALQQGLAQATGREVQLESRVDPSIIGGAITRVGSTVYDGSITTQLQKMKNAIAQSA